jgi:hypothetical protein
MKQAIFTKNCFLQCARCCLIGKQQSEWSSGTYKCVRNVLNIGASVCDCIFNCMHCW